MELSPQRVVHECRIGRERAPLLVIDDFVTEPEAIARAAQGLTFRPVPRAFPGMRAAAGPEYQRLLTEDLRELIIGYFALEARALKLSLCHYSIVTTHPPNFRPYSACRTSTRCETTVSPRFTTCFMPISAARLSIVIVQPVSNSSTRGGKRNS